MSEKRHATLDAKSTDTYQKRKKAREEKLTKEKDGQKILFKKSASLESLQMVGTKQKMEAEDREAIRNAYVRANSVRVSRNRGCNESFRAAVDRSYEKDFPENEALANNNDFAIEDLDDDCFVGDKEVDTDDVVVMRRSKSERDTPSKKKNRNSKLFRGLGTMFRIGASKPTEATRRSKSSSSTNRKSLPGPEVVNDGRDEVRPSNNVNVNTISAPQLDYRQNFVLSKSRSGDLVTMSSRPQPPQQQQQQHQQLHHHHHHQKRQAPPPPPFAQNQLRGQVPHHLVHPQMRKPGEMQAYEYFPSAMMRPGSRVGIADPAQLSTESADYDVLQRLQQRPSPAEQQQQQQHQQQQMRFYHGYDLYGSQRSYNQHQQVHGVHLGSSHGLAQVHMRTGSNLSSGSSTQNNLNTSGGSSGSGSGSKASRPKSNFYEYEMFGLQHQHHYQQHPQQQQQQHQQQQHHHHHPMFTTVPRSGHQFHQSN